MTAAERSQLSPRQIQVYELHEQGVPYRDIATRLGIPHRSAQHLIYHVGQKLRPTWNKSIRRRVELGEESIAHAKLRIARETAEGTRCPCGLTFDASHPKGRCDVKEMRQRILMARRG